MATATYDSSKTPRVVVLIPLRGGSKGIPRKNIRPLCGFPLCAWSISELVEDLFPFDVWASTDDEEIAACAAKWGAEIHHRSAGASSDTASTESVIEEFASTDAFARSDILVLVQATSPLIDAKDVLAAVNLIADGSYDSVVNVARSHRFRWAPRGDGVRFDPSYDPAARPRRQDWSGDLIETGAFYALRSDKFFEWRSRLGGRIGVVESSEALLHEIDTQLDWEAVSAICRSLRPAPRGAAARLRQISLLVCDVDGTLTPGHVLQGADGILVPFDKRDGKGLSLAHEHGVGIMIVTSSSDPAYSKRFERFPFATFVDDCSDKLSAVEEELRTRSLTWDNVCCIGDDLNDLDILRKAAFSACPTDALPRAVRRECCMVLGRPGGKGAVRELVDHLLEAQQSS